MLQNQSESRVWRCQTVILELLRSHGIQDISFYVVKDRYIMTYTMERGRFTTYLTWGGGVGRRKNANIKSRIITHIYDKTNQNTHAQKHKITNQKIQRQTHKSKHKITSRNTQITKTKSKHSATHIIKHTTDKQKPNQSKSKRQIQTAKQGVSCSLSRFSS